MGGTKALQVGHGVEWEGGGQSFTGRTWGRVGGTKALQVGHGVEWGDTKALQVGHGVEWGGPKLYR